MDKDNIIVIDDELAIDARNEIRKEIETFGREYGYNMIFFEAPDPEERLQDIMRSYKPVCIFLDIVHEGKPYSIAKTLREKIGAMDIPVLILTNYLESQLKEQNERLKFLQEKLKQKRTFIHKALSDIDKEIANESLKRERRIYLSNLRTNLEDLRRKLEQYEKGHVKKEDIICTLKSALGNLPDNLKEQTEGLITHLESSGFPEEFGTYPTDFKQTIGYVLKNDFVNKKEWIQNGIEAFTNPRNEHFWLDIRSPKIVTIRDKSGGEIGRIVKRSNCEFLKKFANSNLKHKGRSEEKARKSASRINRDIYEATKWKLREVLKNMGHGEYKLDIGKFTVDGKTIKDFEQRYGTISYVTVDQFNEFKEEFATFKREVLEMLEQIKSKRD